MKIETFALERWMTTYELTARYDITESGIAPMTVAEVIGLAPADEREELLARVLGTRLGYSEAPGSHTLRSLLAETYEETGPEHVLVTTGAIEANFLAFNVLLEPGDHVVAVAPAYQQLHSVPRAIGCDVSLWRLRPEDGFRYDLDELERLLTPRTRMIVVNTPHNPTGTVLSDDELRRIYRLAEERGAWLLCDEAYRWLDVPNGEPLAQPVRNLGPRAISVGTFSKPFGLPGLRTGWLAAPADVIAACWAMRDYVSLSPGGLNDLLASVALVHRDQVIARNRGIVAANLAAADAWFNEHADVVSWQPPRGGLLAMVRYALDLESRDLADRLASQYGVMLAPGSAFGYEGYLRLGVGAVPETFAGGLARTAECLADLRAGRATPAGSLTAAGA